MSKHQQYFDLVNDILDDLIQMENLKNDAQLASFLYTNKSSVSRWRSGDQLPSDINLITWGKATGRKTSEIMQIIIRHKPMAEEVREVLLNMIEDKNAAAATSIEYENRGHKMSHFLTWHGSYLFEECDRVKIGFIPSDFDETLGYLKTDAKPQRYAVVFFDPTFMPLSADEELLSAERINVLEPWKKVIADPDSDDLSRFRAKKILDVLQPSGSEKHSHPIETESENPWRIADVDADCGARQDVVCSVLNERRVRKTVFEYTGIQADLTIAFQTGDLVLIIDRQEQVLYAGDQENLSLIEDSCHFEPEKRKVPNSIIPFKKDCKPD